MKVPPFTMMVPASELCLFEDWSVELGGLLDALSLAEDAITDIPDISGGIETSALFGIMCALRKARTEFDAMLDRTKNHAVAVPKPQKAEE